MENEYIGIIEDPRTEQEKSFDYTSDELVSGAPVEWIEKTDFKSYLIKNQDGSSSCVGQAVAKLLGIHEVIEGRSYKDLSPKFIYTRRANYPSGGMYLPNALEIACKAGSCLESLMPSDMQGEAYMNDKSQETDGCKANALLYKGKSYVTLPIDIDKIAEVLAQGYGVLLGMTFDYDEWTDYPQINPTSKNKCRHGIAAVDFGLKDGVKVLAIDDSWGPGYGRGGQRLISEEFLNKKCFYAGYTLSLPKEIIIAEDFHYQWTTYMRFNGTKNNVDEVKALQKALQTIALFPTNGKIDGKYGPLTRKAVYDFQKKYVGEDNKGVQVGPKTLAALNNKFK